MERSENRIHDKIKHKVFEICVSKGFSAKEEYSGLDWRADVFVENENKRIAFEIQTTKQSLNRTLERQSKYLRDGIIGCWLFESEPSKLKNERIDLPLFRVVVDDDRLFVSLKERKKLMIDEFLDCFINERIKFCSNMKTIKKQKIDISFIKMNCWKCGVENHIYFANKGFYSSCNAVLNREEMLWSSERKEYIPEIINNVKYYISSGSRKDIHLGEIKERYSNTVGHSYTSFGCYNCDSIFGDWYVDEAIMESFYGDGIIDDFSCEVEMNIDLKINVPHWCHTNDGNYCE